jgi:hypothetical protein
VDNGSMLSSSAVSRSYQDDSLLSSSLHNDFSRSSMESSSSYAERSENNNYKSKKTSRRHTSNSNNNQNSSSLSSKTKGREYTQQQLNAEANVAWEEVEFIGSTRIYKKDLLNSQGQLKGDGTIKFCLQDGTLKYGKRTNAPDFAPIDTKKKASGTTELNSGNHDIVKSIEFTSFTLKGYDEEFLVSVNVPKFQSEGFYNESPMVNKIIMPQELNSDKGQYVEVLTRKITNAVILFQNNFPGISPENYQKHIQRCDDKYSLVHLDSPILAIFNSEQKDERKKHLKATKGLEKTKQVMLSNKIVSKYEIKATEVMKKKISYANITSGFEVTLSTVIPAHRLEAHQKFMKTNKGKPFLAWADNYNLESASKLKDFDSNIVGGANESKSLASSSNQSEYVEARFRCVVKYLKITDKPVEINIV